MHFIEKVLKKKIIFKKVKQVDLVILDSKFINFKFRNIKTHTYDQDDYYFLEFLWSLMEYIKCFFKINFGIIYYRILIKKLNPKVGICHEMSNKIFLFKKFFPKKIAVCYQYGYIFKKDINDYYKKHFKDKKLDLYFVYDKRSMNIMKKFIKSKYFINGSTKVNENFPRNLKRKKNSILFISRFRSQKYKLYNNYDKFLVQILEKHCFENNLNLIIAFNSMRRDKKHYNSYFFKEKNFYDSCINRYKIGNGDAFSLSNKSKLVVSNNSNLGYELLFAKTKVVFFNSDKIVHNFFNKRIGPFWYYGSDKTIIKKIIDKVYKTSKNQWLTEVVKADKNFKTFYKKEEEIYKNNIFLKNKIQELVTSERF